MSETIRVEVVYAPPEQQWSAQLTLPATATLTDALAAVASMEGFAALDLSRATVGVWGKVVIDRASALRDGDRVEIYRPLSEDPKEARRKRSAAAAKRKSR